MVFATKILYKIFDLSELIGHNVSGKTFNKFIKNKQALDERRINYIRWLVENHFESNNKEELWKSCRTAINKSIRNNELKYMNFNGEKHASSNNNNNNNNNQMCTNDELGSDIQFIHKDTSHTLITLKPNLSIFQITNEMPNILDTPNISNSISSNSKTSNNSKFKSTLVTLTDAIDLEAALINNDENKMFLDIKNLSNSKSSKY